MEHGETKLAANSPTTSSGQAGSGQVISDCGFRIAESQMCDVGCGIADLG